MVCHEVMLTIEYQGLDMVGRGLIWCATEVILTIEYQGLDMVGRGVIWCVMISD